MRLHTLTLARYRQFIDQHLTLDPYVTIMVGRNDTGKTGLLDHFFDQCIYEGVVASADRPLVPGHTGELTAYNMTWHIVPEDYEVIAFPPEFGPPAKQALQMSFQDVAQPGKYWAYQLDGRPLEAYEGQTADGMPIRKDGFRQRNILPTPRYISVAQSLRMQFEMRPFEIPAPAIEIPEKRPSAETLLLRLAGIRARTRELIGVERPWAGPQLPAPALSPRQMNEGLARVSSHITARLHEWWRDPPGLIFEAKLAGGWKGDEPPSALNSYVVSWTIRDPDGIPYHGAGLLWFLTLLVEILAIETVERPLLLLFDEPATPLHPSAQRVAARFLASIASKHQIIYSTHSPFMIDWNFPQRIRMLVRDGQTKRTTVINKPYHPREATQRIWDPLRTTIGVTLGDVAAIGDKNVLVEGIIDQIFLANASALLKAQGHRFLDLDAISIIPYGDVQTLSLLAGHTSTRSAEIVVVADLDASGREITAFCTRSGIRSINLADFADRSGSDVAIEDVIGIETYLAEVNAAYKEFAWFVPLDIETMKREIGHRSLGNYLQAVFRERFDRNFDKTAIAISLSQRLDELPMSVLARLRALIERILEIIA